MARLCLLAGILAASAAVCAPVVPGSGRVAALQASTVLSSSPTVHSVNPRLAITADGTVHVVWQEGLPGVDADEPLIQHRYQLPDGSWSATEEVYWDGVQPCIATHGSTVAVAFVRNPFDRFDTTEVLYKVRDNVARAWPDIPSAIQGELGVAGSQPDMAFDQQGYLWMVWISSRESESRPYYARVVLASNEVDAGGPIDEREQGAQGPALTMDTEGAVHVVWSTGYPSGEADLSRWEWPAGGRYWVNRESALYDQIREARSPDITADSSLLCVAWHEGSLTQKNEVILSCDRPSGNIWFGNVSQSPTSRSLLPSLASDDERGVMLLWYEQEETASVVFGQLLPPLAPGQSLVATDTMGMPSLAFRDGYANAAWVQETAEGGSEIRFARWAVDVPTAVATSTATPSATTNPSPTATRTPATATPGSGTPPRPTATASATGSAAPPRWRIQLPWTSR